MSTAAHYEADDEALQNFLAHCKSEWGSREVRTVQKKLSAVGIFHPLQLLDRVRSGVINDQLKAAGEKCFTGQTLEAMRAAGTRLDPLGAAKIHVPSITQGDIPQKGRYMSSTYAAACSYSPENDNEDDAGDMERCGFGLPPMGRPGGRSARARCFDDSHIDEAGPALVHLAGQITRGLARFEKATSQASRRNREVVEGLAGVQEDISRIAGKMQAARLERENRQGRRSSCPAGTTFGSSHPQRKTGSMREHAYAPGDDCVWSPPPLHTKTSSPSRATTNGKSTAQRHFREAGTFPSDFIGSARGAHAPSGMPVRPPQRPNIEKPCQRAGRSGFTFGNQSSAAKGTPGRAPTPSKLESSSTPTGPPEEVRRSIQADLLLARQSSKEQQKAVVKRLLVNWHPDRNPESTELATAVFQYIQQERDRLMDN